MAGRISTPLLFVWLIATDNVQCLTGWITPHDMFSSSVGVLGCKINTNRVAYWPGAVSCDEICVKLTYEGRSLHLLHVDSSQGAYDISYDAWNRLVFGTSAIDDPQVGGPVAIEYEHVPAENCRDLLQNGKLPLSAPNSMKYLESCLEDPSSWVANNYELFNICDATCTLGLDEACTLDLATSNQPTCPHQLGLQTLLDGHAVENVMYGTGEVRDAV